VLRHDLVSQIPSLKKKYLHFKNYQTQTINDIFTPEQLAGSNVLNAYTFETVIWLNSSTGKFKTQSLPPEAQFSPTYAILIEDFDSDNNLDILLHGNLYRAKPETGIYDGTYGLFLKGDGHGNFSALSPVQSGVYLKGEVRSLKKLKYKGKNAVIVGKNNSALQFLLF
jgi:enediyne biosynthesis protein E4